MPQLQRLLFVQGLLLVFLAVCMALPALADLAVNRLHDLWAFLGAATLTLFIGVLMSLTTWEEKSAGLDRRHAFILTASVWIVLPAFAGLPFLFSETPLSFTDSYFEAISGLTTTGSTVLVGLDDMPPGLLMWRSLLQWLGGIGIVVMAILVLPFLRIGGMQLFRTERSDTADKALPRAYSLVVSITMIYLGLSIACAICYWLAGMSGFDAVNHAMTTVSTGGYSTHDASLGYWKLGWVHVVGIVFMVAGALPFFIYIRAFAGEPRALYRDSQVRFFLGFVALIVFLLAVDLIAAEHFPIDIALLQSAFNVVSIITTTGYASADYMQWGPFAAAVFFAITVVGSCTGSTSGGIKIFRFEILWAVAKRQFALHYQPHAVFPILYNGKRVPDDVPPSVLAFLFVYVAAIGAGMLALTACGLDLVTSLTAAATAVSNVGPGLGPVIGPAGNFASLPDTAKWLLSGGMLVGRLELFTVLVLLTPHFWRW